MYLQPLFVAQAGAAGSQQSPWFFYGMLAIVMGLMYVMTIRPQRRKEKERREMISNLKSGCRVLLSSGIIGQVMTVKEHTLVIKIAENTKIEVVRAAISQLLERDEVPAEIQ